MTQVKGRPLAGKILVEVVKAAEKTASGIIIPDSAKEKPSRGTVVAVGRAKKDEEMEVVVGDDVLYGKYAGTEVCVDGVDCLLLSQTEVLVILEK